MHSDEKKTSAFSVNHILQAAENTMSSETENERKSANIAEERSDESHVKISLEEDDLWRRFKALTNEMIVTKNGR